MIEWLLNLPCVRDRRVIIDVRGPWPVAIIGMKAATIMSKDDMINFILENME